MYEIYIHIERDFQFAGNS